MTLIRPPDDATRTRALPAWRSSPRGRRRHSARTRQIVAMPAAARRTTRTLRSGGEARSRLPVSDSPTVGYDLRLCLPPPTDRAVHRRCPAKGDTASAPSLQASIGGAPAAARSSSRSTSSPASDRTGRVKAVTVVVPTTTGTWLVWSKSSSAVRDLPATLPGPQRAPVRRSISRSISASVIGLRRYVFHASIATPNPITISG